MVNGNIFFQVGPLIIEDLSYLNRHMTNDHTIFTILKQLLPIQIFIYNHNFWMQINIGFIHRRITELLNYIELNELKTKGRDGFSIYIQNNASLLWWI